MANEKRLIDANALMDSFCQACSTNKRYKITDAECRSKRDSYGNGCFKMRLIENAPTVDAVEVDDMREFAKDVAYQFGYYCQNGGRLHITHGGLSTLEEAFDILGWENPHPVPECECEIDGCHEHATCGALTNDGYKWMCGRHCREKENR